MVRRMNLGTEPIGKNDRRDAIIYLRYFTHRDISLEEYDKQRDKCKSTTQLVNIIRYGNLANYFDENTEGRVLDKIAQHNRPGLDIPNFRNYKNISVLESDTAIEIFNSVHGLSDDEAYQLAIKRIKAVRSKANNSAKEYILNKLDSVKEDCVKQLEHISIGDAERKIIDDIHNLSYEDLAAKHDLKTEHAKYLKQAIIGTDPHKVEDCRRLFALYTVAKPTQYVDTLEYLTGKGMVELGAYLYFGFKGVDLHITEDNILSILLCIQILEKENRDDREFISDLLLTVGKQDFKTGYFAPQQLYLEGRLSCDGLISVLSIKPFFYNEPGILTIAEDFKGCKPGLKLFPTESDDYKEYVVEEWYKSYDWFKACLEDYGIEDIKNYDTEILYTLGRFARMGINPGDIVSVIPYLTKYDTLQDFKSLKDSKENLDRRISITKQVLSELRNE